MADLLQQLKDNAGIIAIVAGIIVELIRRQKSKIDKAKGEAEVEETKTKVEKLRQDIQISKLEAEKLAHETAMKVARIKDEENKHLTERIAENNDLIVRLKKDHEKCEFEHKLSRMQLAKVLKKLDMLHWVKATVFALDDNELVTRTFSQWFKRLPVVNFKSFSDVELFVKECDIHKPELILIDFDLGNEVTANDVRKRINHNPVIFIISGTREYGKEFEGTTIRFFFKDDNYLQIVSEAIIEVLEEKNKHI